MIENTNEHFINFEELLYDAEQERLTFTKDRMLTFWIDELDKMTMGIFPHDLVVIGADSGVWKSEIAYNLSVANAKQDKKVLLFALEGNINEIAWRYTQRTMHQHWLEVRTSEYRLNNWDEVIHESVKAIYWEVAEQWRWENLHIFNKKQEPTIEFITEMMRKSKDYFDLFVIDHLHYIQYNDSATENQEISKAMRTLQQLTGELKKPIVLVWHLRKRDKKHDPTMYDLHGSSNIPKEATTVLLLCKSTEHEMADFDNQLPTERFSHTKFILDKSRAWMPTPNRLYWVFDLWKKCYDDRYWDIENKSVLVFD